MARKRKSKAVVVEEGQPDDNQLQKEQFEEEGIVDPEIDYGDEGEGIVFNEKEEPEEDGVLTTKNASEPEEEEPNPEDGLVPEIEGDQHSEDEEEEVPEIGKTLPSMEDYGDYSEEPELEREVPPDVRGHVMVSETQLDERMEVTVTEMRAAIIEIKAALKGLAAVALSAEEYNCYQINFPRLFRE